MATRIGQAAGRSPGDVLIRATFVVQAFSVRLQVKICQAECQRTSDRLLESEGCCSP